MNRDARERVVPEGFSSTGFVAAADLASAESTTPGEAGRLAASVQLDPALVGHGGGARFSDVADLPGFPASLGQQEFWLAHRYDPSDATHHEHICARLEGDLDTDALEEAIRTVVDRHASLHSSFHEVDGIPCQRLAPETVFILGKLDLGAQPPDLKDMAAREAAVDFLRKPFDLEREIPIRGLLVVLSPRSHILLLVLHHIQTDGASIVQLAAQLSRCYREILLDGRAAPKPPSLTALRWGLEEREHLRTPEADRSAAAWRGLLEDYSPTIPWPVAFRGGKPVDADLRPRQLSIPFDDNLASMVSSSFGSGSADRYRFLLATYLILLHRITGERRITIGVPVHDRRHPGEKEALGLRMKTVPLCVEVDGSLDVRSFMSVIDSTLRAAFRHLRTPVGPILRELSGERSARPFHSIFKHKEDPVEFLDLPRVVATPLELPRQGIKADITLTLLRRFRPGMHGQSPLVLNYDPSVFSEQEIARLANRWLCIQRQCASDPTIALQDIGILLPDEAERLQELSGIGHRIDFPRTPLHRLFLDQAARRPTAPAIVSEAGSTTYAELEILSAAAAAHLLGHGHVPGQPVAVLGGRSEATVIALLGVLRTGSPFVSMDAEQPSERVGTLLRASGATLCLTTGSARHGEDWPGIRCISLPERVDPSPIRDPRIDPPIGPEAAAYVLFTSGSTGTPKGAVNTHGGITNRIHSMGRLLGFGPADRTLFRSSPGFDVFIPEVFLPLATGAAIVMPPTPSAPSPVELPALIARHRITYLHLVPSALRAFLEAPSTPPEADAALRVLWCGGEALSGDLARRFRQQWSARLMHGYGHTETAVGVACYEVADAWDDRMPPPIGRPLPNVAILVMDAAGRPVPPGVRGELWVGGVQTGRGYVNDAAATTERFVADPWEAGSGRRWYRTGDLGRFLPDGNLEFLGRLDDQVKVLGQRVEPGEVSAVLRACMGVEEALVLPEPDGTGSQRLRAWVSGEGLAEADLREVLLRRLPGYMVPFRVHVVASWPLTAHGKTDRRALRRMAEEAGGGRLTPLRTDTERWLAGLWSDRYGLHAQGADADFFRLGGHSLTAMRMLSEVRKEKGVSLTLPELYADARLSSLARRMDAGQRAPVMLPPAPGTEGPAPMSHGQRRMWMLQRMMANPSAYHVTRLLRMPEGVGAAEVRRVLQWLARRHGVLRTRLWEEDGSFWQEVVPAGEWRMEWRQLHVSDVGHAALLTEERERLFELSLGPLWRACWMEGPGISRLYLVFHHSVTDEWSMGIFLGEFWRLLRKECTEWDLPMAGYRYVDYARWQRRLLEGSARSTMEGHWRERLRGWEDMVRLTPDHVVADPQPGRQASISRDLPVPFRKAVADFAQEEALSPFVVWLTIWQVLYARISGGKDVMVATPVSDRGADWPQLIGMCLNTLPVRSRVDEGLSFRTLVRSVRDSLERDLAHAALPFEEMFPPTGEDAGSRKEVQVMFVHRYGPAPGEERISEDDDPVQPYARRDLTVLVEESGTGSFLRLLYDAARYRPETMQSLLLRYESVARQLLAHPGRPVSEADLLLPGEMEEIRRLSGIRDRVTYPDTTVHGMFRRMAQAHSDRPAIVAVDGSLTTYADLAVRSARMASCLRTRGIGRDRVVAIHAVPRPDLLAAMMGVMEAGGAFLLLEPGLPAARSVMMLQQADVHTVLTDEELPVFDGFADKTLSIRSALEAPLPAHTDIVAGEDPSALAYVVFTSGSTGVPKGAMVEHRNILNRLLFTRDALSFGMDDRTLLKSPLSFDVCLTELLLPLVTGGAVVLGDPFGPLDLTRVADLVVRHRVTYLHFVPAVLRAFLEVPGVRRVNGILRMIRCGGESLPDGLMRRCLATLDAVLWQSYGPAETAVAVTLWKCHNGHGHTKPPIGRPNANVDILIMDDEGRPAPPGSTGELWVGGAQTGRGYIHNEPETKQRFVTDPIDPRSGRRYYRTGDLAQFMPDGMLLFQGRKDAQTKVRGVRIEPDDVTCALAACDGVRDAVVLAEPDGDGSSRLRAWVTLRDGFNGDESAIRSSLTKRLPGYMVPFRIHPIDSIPLTTHGKTDHRALRAMAAAMGDGAEGLPLSTPTEQRLAPLWSELLGVEVSSREADFFRLGGHSLLAMRLAGRIRKAFGITVSLSDFYTDGRLDRMAATIDAQQDRQRDEWSPSQLPLPDSDAAVPMSGAQRRMWVLQQILPHPSAYHVACLLPIPELSSSSDVQSILKSLAARHSILRTRLYQDDKGCWQEELPVDAWRLDWAEWEAGSEEECLEMLSAERERGFDLSTGRGWRARWIRENGRQVRLLLVFHHALVDEWSMNLFRREFDMLVTGRNSFETLKKPACSYIDFSRWQQWTLSRGQRERLEAYWQERLSDLSDPVRLIPDYNPGQGNAGRSAFRSRTVEAYTHVQMDDYCKREGLSRFSVWMAVWQILLSRLGLGEEVVLATPVSERDRPEWHDVMGMCLNTLPIRARVDEGLGFRRFTHETHRLLAQDLAHAQLPYDEIIRLADIDLGGDVQGLPQVMFVWHGVYEWSEVDGWSLHTAPGTRYAKNPIIVHFTDAGEDSRVTLEYDAGLFSEQTMDGMLGRLESVARQLMDDPGMRIDNIDILLPGESARLRALSGRDNRVEYPATTLHGIFRQTAERYPERVAVIEADGREVRYAELLGQVERVSAFLKTRSITKESVVAVHMPRSSALLAAMLGITDAGAAFLLMEPSLPLERLRTMAEQARVSAVITAVGMPILPGFSELTHRFSTILASDGTGDVLHDDMSDARLPACVIFTSGSTGVPKGAILEHVNLTNYLFFLCESHSLGADLRSLQKTLLSFDLCLYELLLPMTTGGAVVMATPGCETDQSLVVGSVVRSHVTYLFFAPAQLRMFLDVPEVGKVNGILQLILSAGEALDGRLMEHCLSTLDARLSNAYGPAEAGAVTQWICRRDHPYAKPGIGQPNGNVDIWIMDAKGRSLPPGMSGELWIGGAQTGRGYIHNEQETRKRFVDDPIEPGSGRRYYRTGDLAQFHPDGNLLFHGRMDDQVKVRGVRIELGDVSAALSRCEGVRDAVVLPEPDGEGSNRLCAWVSLSDGFHGDESTIRSSLSGWLPGYMIPFRIHVIDSIPLTPHGKTDHRALQAMASEAVDGSEGLPPTTPTEQRLAALWSEMLGVAVRRRDADFFRLGGYSLMAIRLSGRLHSEFGVIVPLPDLYAHVLLKDMAACIDAASAGAAGEMPLPELPASESGGPVPMSGAQRRMWMLQRMMAHPSAYHVARLLRMPEGVLAMDARKVLEVLARRHGVLRVRMWEEEGSFWQEEVPVGEWRMEWREVVAGEGQHSLLLSEEWERLFDLSSGPLWRACWLEGTDASRLYLVFHHSVTDEWSLGMFLDEFWRLLLGECGQEDLPVAAYEYGDYARWQRRLLEGALRPRLESYWRERLRGWEDMVRLTPDHVVADLEPGRQEKVEGSLDLALCRDLGNFARAEGVSPFVVLLGAWQVFLARLSGGSDILVGTPVSERRRPEWQDVMGMFLNIVPIRLQVDMKVDFREHCRRLKRELESVLDHASLPYPDITALATRDGTNPFQSIVQVLFSCVGAEGAGAYRDSLESERPVPQYAGDDLVVVVDIGQDAWRVRMQYDASRFDGRRISSMLDRYMRLLELVHRENTSPLGALSMLAPGEDSRLIAMGMGGSRSLPDRPLIDRLFDAMAEHRPDAPAVEHGQAHATYAEVRALTDAWASRLSSEYGIAAGDVVALLLPSGIRHVVLLFACWKTGASVVPVDPELPGDRIRYLLDDSGCRFVVCASDNRGHLAPTHAWVDVEAAPTAGSIPPTLTYRDPAAPAYLMYTSGSTGLPKGTFNTHLGFVNTVLSVSRTLEMTSGDRVAQFSSPSFDVSVFEICLAFFNGATLVVPERKELSVLPSFIMGKRVSVAMLTPMVIGSLDAGTLSHVRALMTGGEEARPHDMARLSGITSLFNIYGTTEACVWSTIHPVGRWEDPTRRVPLGRPFENVFACILDADLRLVPTGGVGELCVGGPGLPTGYHRKPELSAERFIPDPFHPGERLYRTGDLARWDDEGRLFYLGRMDGQVKVNGHRVEPAEVVASIEAVQGVARAAVIHRPGQGPESGLVAFLVMEEGRVLDETALRAELSKRLPGHMLPVRCHCIGDIPLNSNGKVDKSFLIASDDRLLEARRERVLSGDLPMPGTPAEVRLAALWTQILGIETIHADDSFFALGGNSLQMIRLMDLASSIWGVTLEPSGIFIHPTLRGMARLLEDRVVPCSIEGGEPPFLPVKAWDTGRGRHLYAMVGGAGSVSEFTKYHRMGSFLGDDWRVQILPDPEASMGQFPRWGPEELASRYAELVRPLAMQEKLWLLGDCIGGIDAFALACALQASGVPDVGLILMDVAAPSPIDPVPPPPATAIESYGALPERQDPFREGFHAMLLALSSGDTIGLLSYPLPASRRQVFRMAVAYGLFDPAEYLLRVPEAGPGHHDAFRHYLDRGWKDGFMPSAGFNPYRYRKIVDGFRPGTDEPVLHALLVGMHVRYVRRKVLESVRRPRHHSDVMAARTLLRREAFRPGVFRGDLHLVMSGKVFDRGSDLGWGRHVEGKVHRHRTEGDHRSYLREHLDATASILKGILASG